MSSRTRAVGISVGAVVLGFIGGFFMGRAKGSPGPVFWSPETARARSVPRVPESPRKSLDTAQKKGTLSPEELESLREHVRSQRGEIGRLVDEVARCKMRTGDGKTRDQKRALALKIYEASVATYANADEVLPERVRELDRMRDGLDPEMTSYFVERYREETAADPDSSAGSLWQSAARRHAWFLVFAAGGEEATRFLKDWISDPATSREDRASGLAALSSVSMSDTQNLEKVPVDASLAATALRLAESDLPGDRSGAADLLGRVDMPESHVALRRLADTDPDLEIRGVALRSMGRIGTRETLSYLRTYPVPSDNDGGWVIKVSLAEGIKDLTLRFPE